MFFNVDIEIIKNAHKVFERLLLWSFPLITDVHVPVKKELTEFIYVSQI